MLKGFEKPWKQKIWCFDLKMTIGKNLLKTGTGVEVDGVVAELNTWMVFNILANQVSVYNKPPGRCLVLISKGAMWECSGENENGYNLSTDPVNADNRSSGLGAWVVCVRCTRDCYPVRWTLRRNSQRMIWTWAVILILTLNFDHRGADDISDHIYYHRGADDAAKSWWTSCHWEGLCWAVGWGTENHGGRLFLIYLSSEVCSSFTNYHWAPVSGQAVYWIPQKFLSILTHTV